MRICLFLAFHRCLRARDTIKACRGQKARDTHDRSKGKRAPVRGKLPVRFFSPTFSLGHPLSPLFMVNIYYFNDTGSHQCQQWKKSLFPPVFSSLHLRAQPPGAVEERSRKRRKIHLAPSRRTCVQVQARRRGLPTGVLEGARENGTNRGGPGRPSSIEMRNLCRRPFLGADRCSGASVGLVSHTGAPLWPAKRRARLGATAVIIAVYYAWSDLKAVGSGRETLARRYTFNGAR